MHYYSCAARTEEGMHIIELLKKNRGVIGTIHCDGAVPSGVKGD
jgi:hypothetical protein